MVNIWFFLEKNTGGTTFIIIFLDDFVLLDAVSDKAKRIVGEVSKAEIAELLS